jgi:hypothetical protein
MTPLASQRAMTMVAPVKSYRNSNQSRDRERLPA